MREPTLSVDDQDVPYDSAAPAALVIAANQAEGRSAAEALAACGCHVRGTIDFVAAAADPGHFGGGLDLLMIEAGAADDATLDLVLARADMAARGGDLQIIANIRQAQIDAAAAQLQAGGVQLLCEPADAERVGAISLAKWRGARLNDIGRDADAMRQRRFNEEVARIADSLVRLARGEAWEPPAVRAPEMPYRADQPAIDIMPQEIRAVIRSRRLRDQFFASALFGDPAWDMLLDLFAAGLERREVSVSSLCIAAAVPPTTALRWIGTMHDAGLFERRADPGDRRRAYIGLSAKGWEGMRAYVSAVKRAGLPLT